MVGDWLLRSVTRDEAEQMHLVSDPRLGSEPVPFGFQNPAWRELRDRQDPGDQLWLFEIPADAREDLAGCQGVALVRDGEVLSQLVIRQICF